MRFLLFSILAISVFVTFDTQNATAEIAAREFTKLDANKFFLQRCHKNFAELIASDNRTFSANDLRFLCRTNYSEFSRSLTEKSCDEECWGDQLNKIEEHTRLSYPDLMVASSEADKYDCTDRYFYSCGCTPSDDLLKKWGKRASD